MIILSIETSCDETAVSILKAEGGFNNPKFKILGNSLISQIDIHKKYGGVFPTLAKREHSKNLVPLLIESLKEVGMYEREWKAESGKLKVKNEKEILALLEREPELQKAFVEIVPNIKPPKIDAIAVTYGPGLEPALWVGINFAKALSLIWQKPLIPVNHMEGHLLSVLTDKRDEREKRKEKSIKIKFPVLGVLISGGHTEIVLIKDWLKYKIVGQTRDDAVGEAFDKCARMMGLPYPGGPEISKLAEEARFKKLPRKYKLPRPMIGSDNSDFSFSGLKTAVLYLIKKIGKLSISNKRIIAREFEDAVVDVLITKTKKALMEEKVKSIILGGGVVANKEIRRAYGETLEKEFPETKLLIPEIKMTTDNAVMIGIAGYFHCIKKKPKFSKIRNDKIRADGNLSLQKSP